MSSVLDAKEHKISWKFRLGFPTILTPQLREEGSIFTITEDEESRIGKAHINQCHEQWAVVVAQLVERLLSIPEVRGSNPVIGKNLY